MGSERDKDTHIHTHTNKYIDNEHTKSMTHTISTHTQETTYFNEFSVVHILRISSERESTKSSCFTVTPYITSILSLTSGNPETCVRDLNALFCFIKL